MGHELLGILSNDKNGSDVEEVNGEFIKSLTAAVVLFPALTSPELLGMDVWEEKTIPELNVDSTTSFTIMPHLSIFVIQKCPKLKMLPSYVSSHALRVLIIENCPQLTGMQPSLPPLLEKLKLGRDVGDLSSSLLPLLHNNYDYPNLNHFKILILHSRHSPNALTCSHHFDN
ncbi:hypothetical protein AQUCO_12900003v1 [Aquilegia coerulea]|uniref:NB-ARC domain-containing protein n=1 Tax=Aquilegia coerulea TaxID=218851 RepID=A0A2G5C1A3_AQUCA|nr:hypothetical protein AQUCO_12900003v1 [Aquilegia coerulea]